MGKKWLLLIAWMVIGLNNVLFAQTNNQTTQKKMFIAVLDLDKAGITAEEAKILTDRLRYELFQTGKFTVLERSKMEDILKEQSFQMSGCTSNECMVEIGRLVGVQAMAGGSVGKIGNLYTLNVRLIDVETATVLKNAVVDYKGTLDGVLTTGLKKVARKLAGMESDGETVITQKTDIKEEAKEPKNEDETKAKNTQDKRVTSNGRFTNQGAKVPPAKKRFRRLEFDLGFGRADVTFEARSADGTLIARKTYNSSNFYFSGKYNLNRKLGIFLGVASGSYGKSDQMTNVGELQTVDFVNLMAGLEYMLGKFFSVGIGAHNTTAELSFKGIEQTISYTQKGIYLRGGIHLPVTRFLQLDGYIYGSSGTKPSLGYFTVGLNFKI